MNGKWLLKKIAHSICLVLLAVVLAQICSRYPQTVEKWYSTGFNQTIISLLSRITGVFPWSWAEAVVLVLTVMIVGRTAWVIFKPNRILQVKTMLVNFFYYVSIGYLVLVLLWGLNYFRLPWAQIADFPQRPASVGALEEVCSDLIEQSNQLRRRVNEDQHGIMRVQGDESRVLERADAGYRKAAVIYSELGGDYGKPKAVWVSPLLSYLGLAGFYFPFTGEANVNLSIPQAMLPFSTCHEMAHQRGWAREDEANFIAYLTCRMSPDPDFQYSGLLIASIYAMNALDSHDHSKFQRLHKNYSQQVQRDLEAYRSYWREHQGPASRITNAVNHLYLKSNRQEAGVYSYDRMVELLLAEYGKQIQAVVK